MNTRLPRLLAALVRLMVLGTLAVEAAGPALAASPLPDNPPGPFSIYLPFVVKPGPAGSPPVIQSFTANPASVTAGQASMLTWSVTGATSLSLAPAIGAVTGASQVVNPNTTTEYTLTATNAHGSVSARATVTVGSAPPAAGSFFIVPLPSIDRPTSRPTVKVDAAGGVHVAFTPDSNTTADPTRPAYYAYCPANCASAAAFTIVPLGNNVQFANLALDPAGRPRLLLRLAAGNMLAYQYWTCDGGCTSPGAWTNGTVIYTFARPVATGEPFSQAFAVDGQGRAHFVYYDAGSSIDDPHWGMFYTYCASGCTAPANWQEVRLLDDSFASDFALTLSPAGQPRLAYTTYDSANYVHFLAYAECNASCGLLANWSGSLLAQTVSASVMDDPVFALRTDSNGRPRMALYTGTGVGGDLPPNRLLYLGCDAADCGSAADWWALDPGFTDTHGAGGVDLALDGQNRPRIAYHAPLAAGFGLYYAWCNAACATSAQGWQNLEIEPSEQVNQELPIPPAAGCPFPQCNPPVPACTVSFWDTGVRASLALDGAGNPRLAYDADHEQGGACGTHTDTRLTRFALLNQP
jgi:hypothetical protein